MGNANSHITNLYNRPTEVTTKDPDVADEQLAVSTVSVQIDTADWSNSTQYAIIQAQGADVRVRFDGTAPTASVGLLLLAGEPLEWSIGRVKAARFIRSSSTDAVIYASQSVDG